MAKMVDTGTRWIGWLFFADLARGLALTLSYLFSKTITQQYPDKEKWLPYPRYRGHHFLKVNDEGDTNCVGCELCAKICPCDCITVVPYEDEKGNRRPEIFEIDLARCLYCGLCEDACPADAIALGQGYEMASDNLAALVVDKAILMAAPRKAVGGGTVVPSKLDTSDGTVRVVETKPGKTHDWWRHVRRH